jgi:hypothetical protein
MLHHSLQQWYSLALKKKQSGKGEHLDISQRKLINPGTL